MLTPKQLQSLPKPLTDIYSELSDFLLQDIALRISKAAKITDTAEYQMYRARALGMSAEAIQKEIARINGAAEEKIAELIREAAERSDEFDRKMLGVSGGNTEQLQKLINAQIEQTRGLCTNLTGTLGFAQRTADGRMVYGSATDFLRKQMDMAQMKVMTGVCDYNTAIRQACFALADSGLRTVYYASGHSDRIEVAVRRALMTSVSQLTQKISEQNAAEFGADGWEISAHMGARPSHAIYQGRQYPNSQYETIVLPLITDYNCRHSAYPIILGVTKPSYTPGELAALDPPPFTYEGRQYTAYEAQQQMRKMERAMRKQKDRCIVADAAGDKDAFTAASIKLRRQKDYYEDFCKAAGTYTEYERTFVSGYNRQLAAKTGAVTRKQKALKNAQVTLTDVENGGIIKEERKRLIDSFYAAQSIDEVKEYAKNVLGFDYRQYDKFNLDAANMVNREITRMYDVFGDIHKGGYLDGIMHDASKEEKDWAAAYQKNFRVVIMRDVSSKKALSRLEKDAKENFDIGAWSTSAPEHSIRHELGHAVGHWLTDNSPEKLKKISALRNQIESNTELTFWTQDESVENMQKAGKYLSYYALYSDDEFIAEAVAEYMNGDPRETARKVVEILLRKE
ncbi:MAG: hypothetical protein HDT43_13305 [Ruminococcaceae bacterium]|nr:hypothetical protein [Oscillospiraceae bacterium]